MNVNVSQVQARVPVTILQIIGDVDGSNFQDVIAKGKELIAAGTRALLLDLSQVKYMSSAGLLAVQSLATMLRGETPPDPEAGWQALHRMENAGGARKSPALKLLNLQTRVQRAFEMVGFDQFLETYSDRETALASF